MPDVWPTSALLASPAVLARVWSAAASLSESASEPEDPLSLSGVLLTASPSLRGSAEGLCNAGCGALVPAGLDCASSAVSCSDGLSGSASSERSGTVAHAVVSMRVSVWSTLLSATMLAAKGDAGALLLFPLHDACCWVESWAGPSMGVLGASTDWASTEAALTVRSRWGVAGVKGPPGLLRPEPWGAEEGRPEPRSPVLIERAVSCCTLGVARLLPRGGLLAAQHFLLLSDCIILVDLHEHCTGNMHDNVSHDHNFKAADYYSGQVMDLLQTRYKCLSMCML